MDLCLRIFQAKINCIDTTETDRQADSQTQKGRKRDIGRQIDRE